MPWSNVTNMSSLSLNLNFIKRKNSEKIRLRLKMSLVFFKVSSTVLRFKFVCFCVDRFNKSIYKPTFVFNFPKELQIPINIY